MCISGDKQGLSARCRTSSYICWIKEFALEMRSPHLRARFLINLIAGIYCTTGFRKLWGLIAANTSGDVCRRVHRVVVQKKKEKEKSQVSASRAGHINRALLELCR